HEPQLLARRQEIELVVGDLVGPVDRAVVGVAGLGGIFFFHLDAAAVVRPLSYTTLFRSLYARHCLRGDGCGRAVGQIDVGEMDSAACGGVGGGGRGGGGGGKVRGRNRLGLCGGRDHRRGVASGGCEWDGGGGGWGVFGARC